MGLKRGDYYFANAVLGGVGRMFFLKIPQRAADGSAPARLIGSLVREGDGGLLGDKEWPVPENSYILGALLTIMTNDFGIPADQATNSIILAGTSQSLKIDKKISGNLKAPFPGVPQSLGIELDYSKLTSITVELGAGAEKRLIPRDILAKTYRDMAALPGKYDELYFSNNRMVIDQMLLVRSLSLSVTSDKDFSVDTDARADAINALGAGVSYKKSSKRTYSVEINSPDPMLFAVGAVQADKFVD